MIKTRRRFLNRVAIVTGAAQGIGLAISRALASEGALVFLNDVNGPLLEEAVVAMREAGRNVRAISGDVTRPEDVSRLVCEATEATGSVHILVNNAGILRSTPIEMISEAEWDLVIDINLKGTFLCSQAVLPIMKAQRYGKVVNMSSMAGRATSTLGGPHYTAAKAGVLGLSRHLARDAAAYGINVNSVCPGIVDTPMVRDAVTPEIAAKVLVAIPFGRLAAPAEVAELVLFLASDDASYITGAAVDIHGGELIIQ